MRTSLLHACTQKAKDFHPTYYLMTNSLLLVLSMAPYLLLFYICIASFALLLLEMPASILCHNCVAFQQAFHNVLSRTAA